MKLSIQVFIGVLMAFAVDGIRVAALSNSFYGETGAAILWGMVMFVGGLIALRYLK